MADDILQELSPGDLPKLIKLYKDHLPYASLAYNFLNTALKWISFNTKKRFVKIYIPCIPYGDWSDGTFMGIVQYSCYDVFVFTLDKRCESLYRAVRETRRIEWRTRSVQFSASHEDVNMSVMKALTNAGHPKRYERLNLVFWIHKETALQYNTDCPEGYHVDRLNAKHAIIINVEWPHKFNNSDDYIAGLIEMNGGYGVFTRKEGKLVSWVLKDQLGCLGLLHTLEEYRRRGFARLVVKTMCKEIAGEGFDPVTTATPGNSPACKIFEKLGFQVLSHCNYFSSGKDDLIYRKQYYIMHSV